MAEGGYHVIREVIGCDLLREGCEDFSDPPDDSHLEVSFPLFDSHLEVSFPLFDSHLEVWSHVPYHAGAAAR